MITKKNFCKTFLSSLLLLILSFSFIVKADTKFPTPTTYKYVNDYVGVINDSETKKIVSIGKELEDKTGAQATIVVIDSTNGIPIEQYAIELFRNWGIGQKGKDNGLLILMAINDKAWRVEVGRGLEGAIPDALSNRIMESLGKPNFINKEYGKGLLECYSSMSDSIAKEYNVTLDKSLNITLPSKDSSSKSSNSSGILIGAIVTLFLLDIIFNKGRVSSTLLEILFWSNINRRNGPRGGGSSGGGSGGGFGGFGGGSSSGGGSSGSW